MGPGPFPWDGGKGPSPVDSAGYVVG